MRKGLKFLTLACATALLALGAAGSQAWAADQKAPAIKLLNDDCVKCHSKEPAAVSDKGGAHKTAIGCQDCHTGHRPTSKNNIPKCSACHSGKPHYELPNCLQCHNNPHTPKVINFGKQVTDPCLTCHTQQIKQLKDNKSKHTALFCSTCHDVHGKIPLCTQCHKPHSAEMKASDCKKCHKAHMPKTVTYESTTPSKDCAACHKKAYDQLTASAFKHKNLACVACHQGKHKMIPKCQDCHGTPHPAAMLAKFPKCGDCHNIAHDLNRWAVETKPAAAAAKPVAAPATKKSKGR